MVAADRADRLDRRPPGRGEQRREALLASLKEHLQENGLEAVNIADIARRAGVTRSAFYFYFENKVHAVASLAGELYDDIQSAAAVLVGREGSPEWRIETVIRRLFEAVDEHRHIYRAVLETRAIDETVRSLWGADRQSFVEPVANMIRAEREAGNAPEGADATALAIVLLDLNDRALEHVVLGGRLSREQHIQALTTVWLRTIYGTVPNDAAGTTPAEPPDDP
ncbi:TetR/AcrR family transcriptional regulator [Actinomadura xylanilytica]|uniref:TetR/AcrR family transcriptional regulator n=1 Tax=Actinomadura xylanilytica TaxID=887459 RepID=UPI00255AAC6D|nr:TetR/AcrR family transcriptional regulator [Actinomadura xylanilytica]MDL4770766.1 TetR/AcrR family transcriptional regulator [Actinomadura xylanilytica]